MSNPLLEAALRYAELGYAVFPCAPGSKVPAIKKGRGVLAATKDPDQIRSWWTRGPTSNVAIACGRVSNLVVLDVDPKAGGFDSLTDLDFREGPIDKSGPCVRTPSGGMHFYFRYPETGTVPNSVSRLGPGLDIRSDGGYVVAPPSKVAAAWYTSINKQLSHPTTPLPKALAALPVVRVSDGGDGKLSTVDGLLFDPLPEGSRNATLAKLAGLLCRRGLDLELIFGLLLCWTDARCSPPLSEEEVRRTVESVYNTHIRNNYR